jgi:hypothetical protein
LGAGLFLEKDQFWGKTCFWKRRPNFGARATSDKKTSCTKRIKSSMQEEKQCGVQVDKTNHDVARKHNAQKE